MNQFILNNSNTLDLSTWSAHLWASICDWLVKEIWQQLTRDQNAFYLSRLRMSSEQVFYLESIQKHMPIVQKAALLVL